ncbi:MAG: helicase-exonuclease AddAB subunit AddA [Oscillospiraceae bacterium]
MSAFKLTENQALAATRRGSSVLVSAAAGSGKTRVLTERLMAYVTDEAAPKSIDSFLIITYTRAAAAELRGRILDEISKRCAADPENRRLRRQSTLCYRAQIGTIHSFCTVILRENCHKLGLSPDFRVGDEDKCAELREKALEKTFESVYESLDGQEGMAELIESVGAGRDDARLARTVLELHSKMQSHAYPEKWAAELIAKPIGANFTDASETVWGRELLQNAVQSAEYWHNRLDTLFFSLSENSENDPLIKAYGDSVCATTQSLRMFLRAAERGWDAARNELPIVFPRLKPLKSFEFEDRKASLTATRDACKKAMLALDAILDSPSEKLLREQAQIAPAMNALLRLTLEFDRAYSAEKRRQNLLDFSDLEHLAIALLCDAETGGPTETAKEISKRYTEIMVDEYQDVNAVQDLIFRCVSRGEKNVFMVGDVKQSIYRFRLADPEIFIEKYHGFKAAKDAQEGEAAKILLQNNFRSDRRVLAACNHVFSNLMSLRLGDLDYDSDCALIPPDTAPPARGRVCLSLLTAPQSEDGQERPDKLAAEARFVAGRIKALVESGETILENGAERPIRYGDIAILLRSPGASGAAFKAALTACAVPVLAEQGGGFFASPEVVVVISLLTVIDNPHRDIPLTAVLASPLFAFSPDELSQIRACDRQSDFYTALVKFADGNEKCARFLTLLKELRALSRDLGVHELLSLIYDRLELPALCAAMRHGDAGATNLMLLLETASTFEDGGYRGLFRFIKYLKRREERGDEPRVAAADAVNAVAIMSIHKSKGLEFPVVFLANTSRKFNTNDLRSPVLVHPALGLGCKITDTVRGIEYPSLARRAIAARLSDEMLSEEMRVLYVALTRAKERLYITGAAKEPSELLQKLSEGLTSPVNPEILKSAPSMLHWLLTAALLDTDVLMDLELPEAECENSPEAADINFDFSSAPPPDTAALAELSQKLAFRYPFEKSVALPSKLTATMLPEDEADKEAQALEAPRERLFRLPDFSDGTRPLTGAERGTATHIVMQFINFSHIGTISEIDGEVARIAALGQLTERQASAVDRGAILRFFKSETGLRIINADVLMREMRFSILCPAAEFFPELHDGASATAGDTVLLQGVVDCCIEEHGELTVIDYKTDYVTPETLSEISARYKKQLAAYSLAMSRLMNKPVRGALLCFLQAGLVAEV